MPARGQLAPGCMAADERSDPFPQVPVETEVLLELLSERLLKHFSLDVWRMVLVGSAYETIRFESAVVTFLAVSGLARDWSLPHLNGLARKYGAHLECAGPPATFAFPEPRLAMNAAVHLQAEAGYTLRMALLTAPCTVASYQVDRQESRMSLGWEAEVVSRKASGASAGSIHVLGETYPLLARWIERHVSGALVTTEVDHGVVSSGVITFSPTPRSMLSTFAGLGLTPDATSR
jgi:hypothetical protein